MGRNPQLPHLLVYRCLEHLGLPSTRQPLETSRDCSHLPACPPAAFRGREGLDRPGAWLAHRGAVCLGNCGISVSKQCTSCHDRRLGCREEERWVFGAHLRCSSRATRPRCLAAQRKTQPGDSTGGEVCSAVPLSFASRFWLGFGFGEVRFS